MRKSKLLLIALLGVSVSGAVAEQEKFQETIAAYGVIKPAKMTNLIAVNNGMVTKIHRRVGEAIGFGKVAISVIERETTRGYRSTIYGKVAKLHVSEGAAVTPGMPLVTVIDPRKKLVEVALSPAEAAKVKVGSPVFEKLSAEKTFGKIRSVSPLVDPDTGGVVAYVQPNESVKQLIGDIVPLEIGTREIDDCKVVKISKLEDYLGTHEVVATAGKNACLQAKRASASH